MRRVASIALLLAIASGPVLAEPPALGRLFLTPQQRQQLDQQRLRNPGFLPDGEAGTVTINGEVRASNGRRTRWINGAADWDGSASTPRLPVGDTLDRATGERQQMLGDGRITIRNAAGKP